MNLGLLCWIAKVPALFGEHTAGEHTAGKHTAGEQGKQSMAVLMAWGYI